MTAWARYMSWTTRGRQTSWGRVMRSFVALASGEGIARLFGLAATLILARRLEPAGFGLITLRRADRPSHWFRGEPAPEPRGPCGAAIEQGFALRDFLETHDDEALLQVRLQAAPGLRWEQQLGMTPDGWSLRESRLCLTEGLAYVGNAGKPEAEFVASCRGKETLGDLLLKVATAIQTGISSKIRLKDAMKSKRRLKRK